MPFLYLIRHPLTQPDPALPASQWRLSAAGQAQVRALVAAPLWAGVAAIYTSAEHKAAAVGEAVHRAHGIPWTAVAALGEAQREAWLDPPAFEAAQRAFFARPQVAPAPGWEPARAAQGRFIAALERILAGHLPGEALAVVAHASVLALAVAHLRGEPPTYDAWRAIGFAAIMAVDRAARRPLTPFLDPPYAGLPALHAPGEALS